MKLLYSCILLEISIYVYLTIYLLKHIISSISLCILHLYLLINLLFYLNLLTFNFSLWSPDCLFTRMIEILKGSGRIFQEGFSCTSGQGTRLIIFTGLKKVFFLHQLNIKKKCITVSIL